MCIRDRTWAAALGFTKEDRDNLGRWLPEASDEYNRAMISKVIQIQTEVASRIRGAKGIDVCSETELFRKFETFCVERGCLEEEIAESLLKLLAARDFLEAHNFAPTDSVPVNLDSEVPDHDEAEPAGGWPQLSLGRRVISLSGKGTVKTLHVVGQCWRKPGIHYLKFSFLDEGERGGYHHICKDCFPDSKDPLADDSNDEGRVDSSSDSSDSSDSSS